MVEHKLKDMVDIKVPVIIFKENNQYVAYSPALDLSTCGENYDVVTRRFNEAAEIFFEEIIEKETLKEALLELGWKVTEKKLIPPVIVSHKFQKVKVPIYA